MKKTMELRKSDLRDIGHSAYMDDEGKLNILSDGPAYERILLREILSLFGCQITGICIDEWQTEDGDSVFDRLYSTDLEWSVYESATAAAEDQLDYWIN